MSFDAWTAQALDGLPLDEQVRRLRAALVALATRTPAEVERANRRADELAERVEVLEHRLALAERICARVAAGRPPDPHHVNAWRIQTRGAA